MSFFPIQPHFIDITIPASVAPGDPVGAEPHGKGIAKDDGRRRILHDAGAVSVTLGPRILRTETAGLCALSVLWTALGEM